MELRIQPALGSPDTTGNILFKQARRRVMSLQMHRIDHDTLGLWSFSGQPREDAVEHPIRLQRTKRL
ncbi:hypothetical protein NA8A_12325 [Nitratireductor indicus C115]|uniref:Uncharacterized protein n=1 Tax=Nitratireductor indicus C115 TaxID=1231190 RepID=K2P4N6_9HYPH|nr:hypothetical protein NA8A_12325 [Nitratireductor indicus C115]